MFAVGAYHFRFAASDADLDQVHRLNYQTFVQEIPQHADPGTGRLVDKHHTKNRYLLAFKHDTLVGMISMCDEPPFSIESRLPNPSILTAAGVHPVEIRLLAVLPEERKSPVMAGLVWALYQETAHHDWTHFVISGVAEQLELYRHLGFEELGPPVGGGRATFVPMWLPTDRVAETMGRSIALWQKRLARCATGTLAVTP